MTSTVPYPNDMWSYDPELPDDEPLHRHIDALWLAVKEHVQFLKTMKEFATVDVFLGYRSNCDTAGVEVPYQSLEMFRVLEVPFSLSLSACSRSFLDES